MTRNDFERLVAGAVAALPAHTREALDNVAFVIEEAPRRKKAKEAGIKINETLLGLYEGVPRVKRGSGYFGVLPDKITVFRSALEAISDGDEDKLKQLVAQVVKHEIGHHLGLDEADLRAQERSRKPRIHDRDDRDSKTQQPNN